MTLLQYLEWSHPYGLQYLEWSHPIDCFILFYPTVNRFCVSSNRTSSNNAVVYELVLEMLLRVFFSLFICMSPRSASVHLCLLFSHSHFFVLLLSQVHFNRHFSSSTDLQAWNFFSRHLRKWKYLEHSWTECPVSCKS